MPHKFLRTSAIRRSAVHIALSLVCVPNAAAALRLLLRQDHMPIRAFQLLAVMIQGCLAMRFATARQESPVNEVLGSLFGSLSPLATSTVGRGFLLNEVLLLLYHVTLSWYPLEALDANACHIPRVNILMQQAVVTACTAILGIPVNKAMQSWLLMPVYCYLDWRYAALSGIPGTATLLHYMSCRGALMLLSKLFFSGVPALVMMQSHAAQKVAVYVICLPLLAIQCFASGIRIFSGIDTVGLWEVWVATVVAFGVGTDFGYVIEELRTQLSRVRMIADDVLPRHVVDTLMQQVDGDDGQREGEEEVLRPRRSSSPDPSRTLLETQVVHRGSLVKAVAPPPSAAASPLAQSPCFGDNMCRALSNSLDVPEVSKAWLRKSFRNRAQPPEADVAEYAEEHPGACILFADVCGFTSISEGASPAIIVNMLNELFSKFDEIIAEQPFLYKLDVIGDCYMVASGLLWHAGDPCPARTITDFAKLMLEVAATVLDPVTQQPLSMRCGIHQGPVVGALLGRVRRKYSLFGDVVNAASRLESTSRPGAIHVSAAIYRELSQFPEMTDPVLGYLSGLDAETDDLPLVLSQDVYRRPHVFQTPTWKSMPLPSAFSSAASPTKSRWGFTQEGAVKCGRLLPEGFGNESPQDLQGAEADAAVLLVSSGRGRAKAQQAWTYRGSIDLKGRAALETYLLQVM